MLKGIIEKFESQYLKSNLPSFSAGDTLQIHCWISEGNKRRLQTFTGAVIAKRNRGLNSSFTVRKQGHGCCVERVFSLHSPLIDAIEVIRRGKVRRAKLYYLRDRTGKAARIKERIILKKNAAAKIDTNSSP